MESPARERTRHFASLGAAILAGFALGCGTSHGSTFDGGAGQDVGSRPDGKVQSLLPPPGSDAASSGGTMVFTPTGPVTDFPQPVIVTGAPSNAATLFGPTSQGASSGGPCLVEPESDVVYPQDWLRPRFTWTASGAENLFELRLHVANETSDLVVYTTSTTWTMSQSMWDSLRTHSPTEPMTLSVRGGVYANNAITGEALGTSTPMEIAPVQATGAIVYWTTSNGTALKGFTVGDDTVEQVLVPSQVTETQTTCIGCHTATPDGEFVSVGISANGAWPNAMALVDPDAGALGTPPPFLGSAGAAALAQPNRGISSFSRAHWAPGDYREIVAFDEGGSMTNVLQWVDLGATISANATGTIARTGDPNSAGAPAWSHDGNTIAYVSTNHFCDGRLGAGCDGVTYNGPTDPGSTADIYTVPYANGAGGTATPLPGASSGAIQEYYPVFSPDDAFLAFCEAPNGDNMYDQADAEVYMIPSSGGTATRLAANDPPACSGKVSPGITNSWPKWGPAALQANGSTYYWLVFSSTRSAAGNPQLYITSVVVTGDAVHTHGSIYLWNQPADENNHTPAWDTFKVPPAGGGPPPQ
jgi:WD40-like Beta Propeller Repeat